VSAARHPVPELARTRRIFYCFGGKWTADAWHSSSSFAKNANYLCRPPPLAVTPISRASTRPHATLTNPPTPARPCRMHFEAGPNSENKSPLINFPWALRIRSVLYTVPRRSTRGALDALQLSVWSRRNAAIVKIRYTKMSNAKVNRNFNGENYTFK